MQEGGGASAPVKIDPPHSFPTFSPREVCYHERGWGEEEEEERETGVTAQGVSRGLPTIVSVLCIHISGSSRASRVHICVRIYVYVRTHARAHPDERRRGTSACGCTWTDTWCDRVRV